MEQRTQKWKEYQEIINKLDFEINELTAMENDLDLEPKNSQLLKNIKYIQYDEQGKPIMIIAQNKAKDFRKSS